MWEREDDRYEEDVGLGAVDRCLVGMSVFPPDARVDELRTTVGAAEDVAVAMLIIRGRSLHKCKAPEVEWIISSLVSWAGDRNLTE